MEVLQMQTDMIEETRHDNTEAINTLIAISVVAKVLADKSRWDTVSTDPKQGRRLPVYSGSYFGGR